MLLALITALTAADVPSAIFTDPSDAHDAWGLLQPTFSRAAPVDAQLGMPDPPPKQVLLLQPVPGGAESEYEMFYSLQAPSPVSGAACIYRAASADGLRTWGKAAVVINGTVGPGEPAWFVNAQNMGWRPPAEGVAGEYITLVFSGKAYAFPGSPFKSHGALGHVLRSSDGLTWHCDRPVTPFPSPSSGAAQLPPFANGSCDMLHPTTLDHDDASMTYDVAAGAWVMLQIVIENVAARTLPSGVKLVDNSPGRRVVGTRISVDGGRSWTCAPTYLNGGGPCFSNASFGKFASFGFFDAE